MKILRHEEFAEGCEASCNGPFDGKWSKTMIGYGSEDDHFVFELVYNYGLKNIPQGNDFGGVVVETNKKIEDKSDPDGYPFVFGSASEPKVSKVILNVENLQKSIQFWSNLLGMKILSQGDNNIVLSYGSDQASLELVALNKPIQRDVASGRIAFSCPSAELAPLQEKVKNSDEKRIHTPLISLDTPGKATVQVVILTDPDGHEICFVGDEAFRELSQVDPKADDLLQKAIKEDWSDEWEAKKLNRLKNQQNKNN